MFFNLDVSCWSELFTLSKNAAASLGEPAATVAAELKHIETLGQFKDI